MTELNLITASWPDIPGFDTAVSHAVVRAVSSGELGDTVRLHRTGPIVAFGRRDVIAPGYVRAVDAAEQQGFKAIERLAGGRAAVFHEDTIAFSWALASADPRSGVEERFRFISGVLVDAIRSLGVDARIGEVPGEYCPGTWSINARGERKLMGVGQRLIRGAAHVGGVIVVDGADRIRDVLVPVYEELAIAWDPKTAGSITDEVGPMPVRTVVDAIVEQLSVEQSIRAIAAPDHVVATAETLAPGHLASRASVVGKGGRHP